MTSLPDWLVERAALDEVGPNGRDRIAAADPRELADRIATLRDDSAAELTRHPARPAVAQIEARIAAQIAAQIAAAARARARRRQRLGLLGVATGAAAVLLITRVAVDDPAGRSGPIASGAITPPATGSDEPTRVKGAPRLLAFRQVGAQAERLEPEAVVRAGDLIQLRYNPGGKSFGLIASLDGAGVVTLHYPLREDAPPRATAVAPDTTTLPHAYALDDAPGFERFFFITANGPIDVQASLGALRSLAGRADSATATLELPAGLHQWSLCLRKPDRRSPNHESP
jgi:hypothetical protein